MKTIKIISLLFCVLIFCNVTYSQSNSYLDFFGKKYFLKDAIIYTPDKENIIPMQNVRNRYTFCGKEILKTKITRYRDSLYCNHLISNINYSFSDCIDFYCVVDSIKISDIDTASDLSVFHNKKNQIIMGFTIIGDSLDYEIKYTNFVSVNPKPDDRAKEYFLRIINEKEICSKFLLKDMYFYDNKDKTKYYLDFEILILR